MDQLVGARIRNPRHARAWKSLEGRIARLRAACELGCRARGRECCERYAREIRRPSLRSGRLVERDRPPAGTAWRANGGSWLTRKESVHRSSTFDDPPIGTITSPPGCSATDTRVAKWSRLSGSIQIGSERTTNEEDLDDE